MLAGAKFNGLKGALFVEDFPKKIIKFYRILSLSIFKSKRGLNLFYTSYEPLDPLKMHTTYKAKETS